LKWKLIECAKCPQWPEHDKADRSLHNFVRDTISFITNRH